MKYRATILYLIGVIALAGVYFYDIHQERIASESERKAKLLFRIGADQIETLSIIRGKHKIVLQKTGDGVKPGWKITEPVKTAAQTFAVEELTEKLAGLKYTRVIAESPEEVGQYGLDSPILILSYRAGKLGGKLYVGSQSPTGDGIYVRIDGQKKVYLIETYDKDAIDKTLFQLRLKRLFTLNLDDVNQFTIVRDSNTWPLIKKGEKWFFKDDPRFPVDPLKVNSLLIRFTRIEASSFEEEIAQDLHPYGLDQPRASIMLSNGKKRETLLFGNRDRKHSTRIYAKLQDRPTVVTVSKWLIEDLPKKRKDLKKKAGERKE